MKKPLVYDGRNIYDIDDMKNYGVEYNSIGRTENYKNQTLYEVTSRRKEIFRREKYA